jgi:hypothetical protein
MNVYTNVLGGFALAYPADWVYEEGPGGAFFAESQEALDTDDPVEAGIILIFGGTPADLEDMFGGGGTPEEMLAILLEDFGDEEEFEVGEIETWMFGETPGVGVEISWLDESSGKRVNGYVFTAVGEGVIGIGLGAAPADEWDYYGPIFQDMLDNLSFFPPEVFGGGEIAYGQTVEGVLVAESEQEWVFEGRAGDAIAISMIGTDYELDCYLELYTPNGDLAVDDDDSGEGFDALIVDYVLGYDGTWLIVARGSFGSGGAYELSLEQVELVIEDTLVYGDEVAGTLDTGERHHYLFDGDEGDVVTISMIATDELLDSYLELYSPSGEQVMTDDDSAGESNAQISEFELLESGTYRIVARGYSDYSEGEYELTLTGP